MIPAWLPEVALLPFATVSWVAATAGCAWWVTAHALTGGLR